MKLDFCVVNGENATEGKGIDEADAKALFRVRCSCYYNRQSFVGSLAGETLISKERNILRPLNYPKENPGTVCPVRFERKRTHRRYQSAGAYLYADD